MEWYNILTIVLGAFGGVSGFIAIYNARVNRTKIEVDVLNSVITRLDTELLNKNAEFDAYKQSVNTRVEEVKKEVLEERRENARFRMAIYQAYRCRLPVKIEDCPVIKAFQENDICEECTKL